MTDGYWQYHIKMGRTSVSTDIPDSATTLRDPIFHNIKINEDDDDQIKTFEGELDPRECSARPSDRSSPSTSHEKIDKDIDGGTLQRQTLQAKEIWKFRLRPVDDDEPE